VEFQPLVSIIINNYNYDRFLTQAIDSALSQTYSHTEVIVVDDGSTDSSRDIIAGYGDRIIPVLQENGKQGKAFNSGFAASRGEIIIFLDADDYLLPNAVDRIVSAWKPGIAKVHYRLTVVDADGEPRGFSYPQGTGSLASGEVWQTLLNIGTYRGSPTSGNAHSRHALAQVTPIPDEHNTTADDYLSVLIPLYGEVVAIDEPLGAYRIHTSNQWALATVSSDRFRRFVQHDLQRCELLTRKARDLGYEVPEDLNLRFFGRVWSRLASLRLDPAAHPIPSDRPLPLIYWGLRALWLYSIYNPQKRLIFSLWFIWVGMMPRPLAEPAITWLFAPQHRPKVVSQTLKRLRALVS
jgi:glycosyltransferase involved in cell wall biosynthesis